jgi:hypothetical protein
MKNMFMTSIVKENNEITFRDLYDYVRDEWDAGDEKAPEFLKPINGIDGTFVDDNGAIYTNIVTLGRFDSPSHEELEEHFFSEAIWSLENEPDNNFTIMLHITNFMENAMKKILDKHCGGRF